MERWGVDREKAVMDAYLAGRITDEEAGAAIAVIRASQESGHVASTPDEIRASSQTLVKGLTNPTLFPTQPNTETDGIRADATQVVNVLAGQLTATPPIRVRAQPFTGTLTNPNFSPDLPASSVFEARTSRRRLLRSLGSGAALVTAYATVTFGVPASLYFGIQGGRQVVEGFIRMYTARQEAAMG